MEEEKNTAPLYIIGEVIFTIFENVEEHFSIAKINIQETTEEYEEKEIVIKGHFSQLQKNVPYQFFGSLVQHKKFGLQYDVHSYKTFIPETKEAVIDYLSSDLFYGVGKRTATAIVEHLGEQAIDRILADKTVLDRVPQLGKKTADSIVATLQENQGFEQVAVTLGKYGIGLKMAQQLYKIYADQTMVYTKENPYQFVFDIEGFGFMTADKMAEINGMDKADERRIQASCIHILQESVLDGHVYLPLDLCATEMLRVLQVHELKMENVSKEIKGLAEEKKVIMKDGNVYLPSLYYAEDHFSSHLLRLLEQSIDTKTTDAELLRIIGDIEAEEVIAYGHEQFEAIKKAMDAKVMILTGGPGTGKTTVIKGILKAYGEIHDMSLDYHAYTKKADYPFILTAPTGRAAKRLQESTGIKAMTIHRLLGWDGGQNFEKNEYEKLTGKYLIIDEFSMVDTWLANHLFKAIPTDMQVLLVGDEDQLPSVGPGQLLADLLASNKIPSVQLTEVYRQEEGSKIIQLAHAIKNDTCTIAELTKENDFSFLPCEEHQVTEVVSTVIDKALQKGYELQQMQVLAPMYKTQAGINQLNQAIQALVNPKEKGKRERVFQDVVYRVGDRVIQLVNQPEDGVYNGDIGEIIQIFSAKENAEKEEQIVVAFDDTEVVYPRSNYIHLAHAYCISIHKSQGSEFPIVILPVVKTYRRMLRKNLLYTAITRSKQSLVICGDMHAFIEGIQTYDTNIRYTTLQKYIVEKIKRTDDEEKVEELPVEKQKEKEEDSLSPYDFM